MSEWSGLQMFGYGVVVFIASCGLGSLLFKIIAALRGLPLIILIPLIVIIGVIGELFIINIWWILGGS